MAKFPVPRRPELSLDEVALRQHEGQLGRLAP